MEKRGIDVLKDKRISKSTAFNAEEKKMYGLRGLLPYAISSQEIQKIRVIENIRRKESNIEKYIFLSALQDRNERLFYRTVIDYLPEILPIIYTPTVGEVCQQFSHIYRIDKGFYITPEDKGDIPELLGNWPEKDVRVIVVTDGSRILGLGDLGCNGMGIPIGKLSLYTAGGGIRPEYCLPVMLDMGTDNESLLHDMMYLGYPHKRLKGQEYDEIVDEFIRAVQAKYPRALIQFEDFVTHNAYKLLQRYQNEVLCFNDDIQGTAAVALAGVFTSLRITESQLKDQRIMFLGAGSAATGIADLMLKELVLEGLSETDALSRLSFVDINGLLVDGSESIMPHNERYVRKEPSMSFAEAIRELKPTILIGASGAKGAFTREIISLMSSQNDRPVIFALSNPTSKSECTAEEAYEYSEGRVIFASGSPFAPVSYHDQIFVPGQANNVYIFPGVGLGALAVEASRLPDSVFLIAAAELARQIHPSDLETGTLYPRMTSLRTISFEIAVAVAEHLYEVGLARLERPKNIRQYIKNMMYDPTY
ncbi:MAG: NAD-dependent malic enzyme [Saprospiraceae bacterium]|jgi:malate dehydrogenase (oxaloacetate-decarboxylating)(NADP+)|nr:NAD-dependent malic enzyme [Saprospiraceae bacterium]